jgi:F-type H+-transporting ATPase subunit b
MDHNGFFEAVALWSQVAGAVAFLVVLILLFRKYLMPAVKANQDARNAEIAEAEARRERIKTECAQARAEVTSAEQDAAEILARVVLVESREREKLLADARHEGERLVQNAHGELERARMAARDRLRIEMIEKALVKARAEAVRRIDPATEERLVEATIEDLTRGKG